MKQTQKAQVFNQRENVKHLNSTRHEIQPPLEATDTEITDRKGKIQAKRDPDEEKAANNGSSLC